MVALLFVLDESVPPSPGIREGPRSVTLSGGNPSNTLLLGPSIVADVVDGKRTLVVRLGEFNPSSASLNATGGRSWGLEGLRIDSCYASIYPFGVALYQGRYTEANVTTGKPLEIFPVVPCPLLFRLITGYYFNPASSKAIVLPGTGPSIPMSANVTITGTYAKPSVSEVRPLAPGVYTVAAGDEWGTLVFLYFRVS